MLDERIKVLCSLRNRGLGLFAESTIQEGTIVWSLDPNCYAYTLQEVLTLPTKKLNNFIEYGFQIGKNQFCNPDDASKHMNHSCNPNCKWSDNNSIQASTSICEGEEITYDYTVSEIDLPFKFKCFCGSSNCKGEISNF